MGIEPISRTVNFRNFGKVLTQAIQNFIIARKCIESSNTALAIASNGIILWIDMSICMFMDWQKDCFEVELGV